MPWFNYFFISFLWISQTWAGPPEDLKKIDDLRISLINKGSGPFDPLNKAEIAVAIEKDHLDLTKRPNDMAHFYEKLTWAGGGGHAGVLQATLAYSRPGANLEKGNTIALRISQCILAPRSEFTFSPNGYDALFRLSNFKNPTHPAYGVTDFYPGFYGVYFTGPVPRSLIEGKFTESFLYPPYETAFRVEEMEWVDTTFQEHYDKEKKIPDSVVFETLYGEWAARCFFQISIGDCKPRNYGLKRVNMGRCYHLGETLYYFNTPLMPMRIDLEESSQYAKKEKFQSFPPLGTDLNKFETSAPLDLRNALDAKKGDLFTLFERFFSAYIKTPQWVEENAPTAKHYFLNQSHIDFERGLPWRKAYSWEQI